MTRAADIRKVAGRWEIFSSARQGVMMDSRDAGGLDIIRETLLGKDGDDHDRQRAILDDAFAPQRVAKLKDSVRATADRHLDAFVAAGPGTWSRGLLRRFRSMSSATFWASLNLTGRRCSPGHSRWSRPTIPR